jgi:hypothetical protein
MAINPVRGQPDDASLAQPPVGIKPGKPPRGK